MQTLESLNVRDISGVLTDIDDTLTKDGQLSASTFNALHQLKQAGYKIIPVTGRSSGWGHMVISTWPVDAIVVESGGAWFTRDQDGAIIYEVADPAGQTERATLHLLCEQLVTQHPPLQFALDNRFRFVDVAIDFNETTKNCPQATVDAVIDSIKKAGFNARASSIHINAWSGDFDKGPSAQRLIQNIYPSLADQTKWVFIGDAPNDESMFGLFSNSVAVANFLETPEAILSSMKYLPSYISKASFGEGFEELADQLLKCSR